MDNKTRPDETGFRFIGKPIPRKEDERLITGKGRFSDDFNVDGQAYAVMVRSPYPHARIVAIDAVRAKAMPGVVGVLTGADCVADNIGPVPHDPVPKTKYDMKLTGPGGTAVFAGPHALLPADKVRHVGEAVVMVVAETKAQAMDAAEAVEVATTSFPSCCTPRMRCSRVRLRCGTRCRITSRSRLSSATRKRPIAPSPARPRGEEEIPHWPRYRRADGAALRARTL